MPQALPSQPHKHSFQSGPSGPLFFFAECPEWAKYRLGQTVKPTAKVYLKMEIPASAMPTLLDLEFTWRKIRFVRHGRIDIEQPPFCPASAGSFSGCPSTVGGAGPAP